MFYQLDFAIPHKRIIFVYNLQQGIDLTVKKLLSFIIPIIIAIAFINGIEQVESTIIDDYTVDLTTENNAYLDDCSVYDFDLYIPRQTSTTSVLRLQNHTKRTNISPNNHFKTIKAGKIEITGSKYISQQKSSIVHSSFTKPFHRLISLGKLVI